MQTRISGAMSIKIRVTQNFMMLDNFIISYYTFIALVLSHQDLYPANSLSLVSLPKQNENNIYAIENKIKHSMRKRKKNNVTTNDKVSDEEWKKLNYLYMF